MVEIVAEIDGRRYGRSEVLAWEDRRIDAAAKKLGVAAPAPGPVEDRRQAFLASKMALGSDEIMRRLAGNVRFADRATRLAAAISPRRRLCVTDLYVPDARADEFVRWFEHITYSSLEDELLRACPDHFVLRTEGRVLEVIETTGGSPATARFTVNYDDDASSLVSPIDPLFSHRLDGIARADNGTPIGGVRHQFRDHDGGVHARLTIEFPLPTLSSMIAGHRWHLACEFSNWFEAAGEAGLQRALLTSLVPEP